MRRTGRPLLLIALALAGCASAPPPAPPQVLSREAVRARLGEGKGAIPLGSGSEYSAVVARVTDLLPGHLHRERTEVVVVLAGSGQITVGGTKSPLAPGTVVYIPPGVYHDVTPGPGGVDAVIVRIPPTGDEDTVPVR